MTQKSILDKGVTIVELVVYMGLMSIFLLILLDIFTATLNTKLTSESTSALNQDARFILDKFTYDIQNADSITAPALGVTSSSLQLTESATAATYALSSDNLTKTVGGVPHNLNGLDTAVTNLSFKNIGVSGGKPTIQISYTLTSRVHVNGRNATQTIDTTIGTR